MMEIWNAVRGIVREKFTFRDLKELAGASGLPVNRLDHLQQRQFPARGASKSDLMDGINRLIEESINREECISRFIEDCISRKPSISDEIDTTIARFDWRIQDGIPVPSAPHVDVDNIDLSEEIQASLATCIRRVRDNDFSGAITSICGAVDLVTSTVYEQKGLGNHRDDSYQQRVNRSFSSYEEEFLAGFNEISSFNEDEAMRIWSNYRSSINQSAYVLGAFRRTISDAHGIADCPRCFVQKALDCGTFILRSFSQYV
jgi:hypothetical protein